MYSTTGMVTKWGSCNPATDRSRVSTELVEKPEDLLEYVLVHELAHLIAPNHGEGFVAVPERHYPGWQEARDLLDALPLADPHVGNG